MSNHTLEYAKSLARDVRDWAENLAYDETLKNDLLGWCAIASAELSRRLTQHGIDSEIHISENENGSHAFILVDDYVVDVTATQFTEFSHQPIVVLHHREAEIYDFYQSKYIFESADDFRLWQKKTKWPASQIAFA
jgi:hypothetical protein